jgi:DNA-binding CsgD family transcriptional regulator
VGGHDAIAQQAGCRCLSPSRHLTDREAEVLTLVATDLRDVEIAKVLGLSIRTVQSHAASAMRKAGTHTRAGLIARSFILGILAGSPLERSVWSGERCLAPRVPRESSQLF